PDRPYGVPRSPAPCPHQQRGVREGAGAHRSCLPVRHRNEGRLREWNARPGTDRVGGPGRLYHGTGTERRRGLAQTVLMGRTATVERARRSRAVRLGGTHLSTLAESYFPPPQSWDALEGM